MAKRKTTKRGTRAATEPARPSKTSEPPNLLALASPLAGRAELLSVFFAEAQMIRTPDADPELDDCEIETAIAELTVRRDETSDGFVMIARFSFLANGQVPETAPAVEISCMIVAVYQLDGPTIDLTDTNFQAFGQTTGLLAVWPYWREFVQGSLSRMGLRPVVMPLMRI